MTVSRRGFHGGFTNLTAKFGEMKQRMPEKTRFL